MNDFKARISQGLVLLALVAIYTGCTTRPVTDEAEGALASDETTEADDSLEATDGGRPRGARNGHGDAGGRDCPDEDEPTEEPSDGGGEPQVN